MTRPAGKLLALALAMTISFSAFAGPAAGATIQAGNTSVGAANSADVVDATITPDTSSSTNVGWNVQSAGNVDATLLDSEGNALSTLTDQPTNVPQWSMPIPARTVTSTEDVTLKVTEAGSNTVLASDTSTISVKGFGSRLSCNRPFAGAPGACANASSYLVDTSTAVTFDGSDSRDDGSIQSYSWDFDGDGSADASGKRVTHTFASAGHKTVRLTVTDDQSNTDAVTLPINVQSSWPPSSPASVSVTSGTVDPTTSGTIDVDYDTGGFSGNAKLLVGFQHVRLNPPLPTKTVSGSGTTQISYSSFQTQRPSDSMYALLVDDYTDGYGSQANTTLAFGWDCVNFQGSACPSVSGASVSATDGTDVSNVAVDAEVGSFGMIDVSLHEAGNSGVTDLTSVNGNVDTSTPLWVNFTVSNADPGGLMGRADVDQWFTTGPSGSKTVHVKLSPIQQFRNERVRTYDPTKWPTQKGTATIGNDALVSFSMMDLGMMPQNRRDAFRGATLTTDAQAYKPPMYNPPANGHAGNLSIDVAGPHYETDGTTQNAGFYEATIPSGMLDAWGISDPSELTGKYQGQQLTNMQVSMEDDGDMHVYTDIHYSSGTIELVPQPDSGSSGGSDVGIGIDLGPDFTETTDWNDEPPATEVAVDRHGGRANVTVHHPVPNESASLPVDVAAADGALGLDRLDLTVSEDSGFTVNASASRGPPADTPALDAGESPNGPALGYLRIDHSVPDEQIENASLRFRVRDRRLADRSLAPDDVVLYRYHDGEWHSLATTHLGTTNGNHTFEAVSPGLSTFAIGPAHGEPASGSDETTATPATTDASGTETPDDGTTTAPPRSRSTDSGTATTSGAGPGYTAGLGVIALLLAIALRRRD
ncbi:MAG: PGF-pre-PGF domain-containing protein [Haloarculaceae archaeon]